MTTAEPITRPAHVPTIGTNGNQRPRPLTDYRCGQCGKLLFRGRMYAPSVIEIRCRCCKRINIFDAAPVNV